VTIATGDSVTLEYTGRLDDETVFDTSREEVAAETGLAEARPDREFAPLTVEVGAEEVIEGIEEGLVGLETGETANLTIPLRRRTVNEATRTFRSSRRSSFRRCSAVSSPRKETSSRRRAVS